MFVLLDPSFWLPHRVEHLLQFILLVSSRLTGYCTQKRTHTHTQFFTHISKRSEIMADARNEPLFVDGSDDAIGHRRKGGFAPIRCIQRFIYRVFPPGGVLSSSFSLASGSLGAGILGLPSSSNTCGLGMAMIYLVIITFFSIFSMHLLAVVAGRTKARSFEAMARCLFPQAKGAFSYWVAFIRWFYAFGACIGYVISIGNCLSPIFDESYKRNPNNTAIGYFQSTAGNRLLVSLVWLCIMLPLVIPKHVDTLRYASMFAVAFMTYFVMVIIVHSGMNGFKKNVHNVRLSGSADDMTGSYVYMFRTGNTATTAMGTFFFAYICQVNALEVYWDMRPEVRTVRNYTYASTIGMLICGSLYVLVSIFGYFDFGSEKLSSSSILLMYNPLSEGALMLAYVGVMVKLCVSYALLSIASRNTIYYVIGWQKKYGRRHYRRGGELERRSGPALGSHEEMHAVEPAKRISSHAETSREAVMENRSAAREEHHCMDADPQKLSALADAEGDEEKEELEEMEEDDVLFVDNIPFWKHLIVVLLLAVVKLILGLFIPPSKCFQLRRAPSAAGF
ncbi:amino acid permease [Strigomonas culicis]|uniref:Amino acid permease n=1 Tax=Strigomonas culicis TaxID=28005 RepID=S9TMR5_9TRYP|nr:amino acid permease [Strigomonas culicis]|eukprot:EPY19557.1 amino acid permease [Strigomonas culicis]